MKCFRVRSAVGHSCLRQGRSGSGMIAAPGMSYGRGLRSSRPPSTGTSRASQGHGLRVAGVLGRIPTCLTAILHDRYMAATKRTSDMTANACVFCRIIAGDELSQTIHEDDNAIAFLDIAQVTKGHSLVVPRKTSHGPFRDITR
ncbi:HIT family protein [Nonomuraea ferruginea]